MLIQPSKIIFSQRKTICLQITKTGEFIVRAPKKATQAQVQDFVAKKQAWITKSLDKVAQKLQNTRVQEDYTAAQIKEFKTKARTVLQTSLEYWSLRMNLRYTKFRLSGAKARWGSCSSKDVISLNWHLVFTEPQLIDYVVIHELAHIEQKNHSVDFWSLVSNYDSEYKQHRKDLKSKYLL